MIVKSIVNIL